VSEPCSTCEFLKEEVRELRRALVALADARAHALLNPPPRPQGAARVTEWKPPAASPEQLRDQVFAPTQSPEELERAFAQHAERGVADLAGKT